MEIEDLLLKQFRDTWFYVAEDGRIFNSKKQKWVTLTLLKNRYYFVSLNRLRIYAHRVVAEVYHGNQNTKLQVNHIDGNRTNNHYTNLEWVTPLENIRKAWENNQFPRQYGTQNAAGEKQGRSKLKNEQVIKIREMYASGGYTPNQLAELYGVSAANIRAIVKNKSWRSLL